MPTYFFNTAAPKPNCPSCRIQKSPTDTSCQCGVKLEPIDFRAVTDPTELAAWLQDARKSPSVSFDIETTGPDHEACLDPYRGSICGISFCREDEPTKAIYVPLLHTVGQNMDPDVARQLIAPFLAETPMSAHNFSFEYSWIRYHWGVDTKIHTDSQLEAFFQDANRAGGKSVGKSLKLKDIARDYWDLAVTDFTEMVDVKKGQTFADVPLEKAAPYGCQDAYLTMRIVMALKEMNDQSQKEICRLERSLIPVVAAMELRGIWFDTDIVDAELPRVNAEIDRMEREVLRGLGYDIPEVGAYFAPIKLSSPSQIAKAFFSPEGLGLVPEKRGKASKNFPEGQPSVDKKTLQDLRETHPVIDSYLTLKETSHMRDSFMVGMKKFLNPKTGFIHGNFNQAGAPTGRFSHSSPNLANQAKHRG